MAFLRRLKLPAPVPAGSGERESGIALFMVISAMSVLAILVTEFTYIAQVNQTMAYDGLDQIKVHYLAKSALKLSLLRLKAYQNVKNYIGGGGGSGAANPVAAAVPRSLLEKIWNFPFFYPIPTEIPGLSPKDKDAIQKFQKASGLDGKFSALIESESSKMNLNLILPGFAPTPSASPSKGPSNTSAAPALQPTNNQPNPQPSNSYNADAARRNLADYLFQILTAKFEADPEFASNYRDFRMEDFMDGLTAWADRTYERRSPPDRDPISMKRAPFYSVSELHMLPGMDDTLYDLFSPALTASTTAGINVNTLREATLRGLLPGLTKDEVSDFFKFRDSDTEDNAFKSPDDFYAYLLKNISSFRGSQQEVDKFKQDLAKRGIPLLVDESQFRIVVQAQVNQSIRRIEAWVTLGAASKSPGTPAAAPTADRTLGLDKAVTNGAAPAASGAPPGGAVDPGLTITFMRIL